MDNSKSKEGFQYQQDLEYVTEVQQFIPYSPFAYHLLSEIIVRFSNAHLKWAWNVNCSQKTKILKK